MTLHTRWLTGLAGAAALAASIPSPAQVNVLTWHNDLARSGANTQESILTPANVQVGQFGKQLQIPLDGAVYAQPLVLSGVAINGASHNVVYVVTEHDSVYALDADSGALYAQVSLIPAGGTTVNVMTDLTPACSDIPVEIGITGTPVIDPATQTLYVVAKSKVNGAVVQYLHALNTTTLAENPGSPVEITAAVHGSASDADPTTGLVTFNPTTENQRPGLLLDQGHVVISWASHCDNPPYHGWVIVYNGQTLAQEAAWNATPNGEPNGTLSLGGIWMAGAAPAADTDGNFYLATGNGYEDGITEFGDSVVKLGLPGNGQLPVIDYFVPFNQTGGNVLGDLDLGSGGVVLLPTTGNGTQLLAQAGKSGTLRLLDRTDLGQNCLLLAPPCSSGNTQIPQEMPGPVQTNLAPGPVFSTPVVWNGRIYWNDSQSPLAFYALDPTTGLMSSAPASQSTATYARTDAASLSASGLSNGIYWLTHSDGTLFAFDANDLTHILWSSGMTNGDQLTSATKFAPPTIANGHVFVANSGDHAVVPTAGYLVVYGLLTGNATLPTFSPGAGTYTTAQTVAISDTTPGATFYYTTDGSTPTTASTKYSAPITVSAGETLKAIAMANGLGLSYVASATYTITSGGTNPPVTATPTFTPAAGVYNSAQSVTITDITPGAIIHYTTDGTTPTAASTSYSGPITVSVSQTLEAIAIASGDTVSAVASASYTIEPNTGSNPPAISDPNGFNGATGFAFLNGAAVASGALQLTDGGNNEARAVWYTTPVNVQSFTTDFTFQITPADPNSADGFTFTLQNAGSSALGGTGGALGYQGISPSVAVKFDLFSNSNEGPNSTGIYTDGAAPTVPALDLTASGINLHNADPIRAHLTYDGTTLTLTLTDTVSQAVFTTSQAIDIPGTLGGNTALVGFTAGTGGTTATQSVLNWTYTPGAVTAAPTFTPVGGIYTQTQSVTLTDTTPNATIYYTTDGSTPTTASTLYAGPITVNGSETIKALAVVAGAAPGKAFAAYLVNSGNGVTVIDDPTGFNNTSGLTLVGGASLSGSQLQLTDGGTFEARAAWSATPVDISSFTTDFWFQITPAAANTSDGFTFALQNQSPTAVGGIGGALGYQGIAPSVAVKFDLLSNDGEGNNSTGFYTNGAAPTVPAIDLTSSGIDLHSGDLLLAHLSYDGTTLTLTLTDAVTRAVFTTSQVIDLPGILGGTTAYVGFTGGTGGTVATQSILNWTYMTR